jgi:hypothetical protein
MARRPSIIPLLIHRGLVIAWLTRGVVPLVKARARMRISRARIIRSSALP